MKNWYEKATKIYQLSGKSEGTVKAYTRAVRLLVDHYGGHNPLFEFPYVVFDISMKMSYAESGIF